MPKIPGHYSWYLSTNHLMVHVTRGGVKWMKQEARVSNSCKTIALFHKTTAKASGPFAIPK